MLHLNYLSPSSQGNVKQVWTDQHCCDDNDCTMIILTISLIYFLLWVVFKQFKSIQVNDIENRLNISLIRYQ